MKSEVQEKLDGYPEHVKALLMNIRNVIFEVADTQDLGEVKESLKWGEPSYSVKSGSAVRFDWKFKHPEQYLVFFNCKTKLIDTFRELYSETLIFQGNRAIILSVHQPLPENILRQCIQLSLTYKNIKHLPLLGM